MHPPPSRLRPWAECEAADEKKNEKAFELAAYALPDVILVFGQRLRRQPHVFGQRRTLGGEHYSGACRTRHNCRLGYDIENLTDPTVSSSYSGEVSTDRYGRKIPKHAHGTANLDRQTSSTKLIVEAVTALFDRIMNPKLLVRRIYLTANHVVPESEAAGQPETEQLDLFTDYAAEQEKHRREAADLEREKRMQHAMLKIQEKYGKNAILKGTNLQEGATTIQRNGQIGGHKA